MSPLSEFQVDWPAVSELLDEALALPAAARADWLAGLSAEHARHREALSALLATQAGIETRNFLDEGPTLNLGDTPSGPALAEGAQVGAYRLIREIGRGGMGTVWLAERSDGLMRRRVALKLPRVVWGDTFAERLGREREILASLGHEHIARLYDAGIDAHGRPFLAMEYVQGEPIDAHCRNRALPVPERVGLLLQVMAAVAHAHARLVVHRDLKPGNILVSADAKVSLLDFGIAKLLEGELTEETALTRAAGHALTPDYASPEQIRGEPLGTASDIYSLAVVAYELLAGGRPYRLKRASAAELEQAIATAEAPLASNTAVDKALRRQLQGDLDAILNKALKKRPDERYATMDAFAQDLRRWQDGEPVQARPDGLAYRAAKFVGRHRLQVAAGSVTALALVGGAAVALWQAREARSQAERAQTEMVTAKAVQGFMESVFKANAGDQVDPKRAAQTTARELLDRGADRIDTELAAAPMARLRLLGILGAMYGDMVANDKQLELQRKRLALARAVTGPAGDETVLAMAELSNALTVLEHTDEAAALLKDAAAMLDARHDTASPTRVRVLLRQALLDARTDPNQGLAAAERALAIARRELPNSDFVLILRVKGENALYANDFVTARAAFAEAVQLVEARPELGASQLSLLYGSLGEAQRLLGDYPDARHSMQKAIDVAGRRAGAAVEVHSAELTLANLLYDTGRYPESLQVIEPALAWSRSTGATAHSMAVAEIPAGYGRALVAYGRVSEGLEAIDEAIATIPKLGGQAPGYVEVPILTFRARALISLGRLAEAHVALDKARAMAAAVAQPSLSAFIDPVERRWLVASGRAAEALAALKASDALSRSPVTSNAALMAGSLAGLSWFTLEAGDAEAAQAQATAALRGIEAGGHADYQRDIEADATLVLGRALLRQGHAKEALPVLQKAVEQHRAEYDPEHSPAVAEAWRALADARRALGDLRAADAAEDAGRIRTSSPVQR